MNTPPRKVRSATKKRAGVVKLPGLHDKCEFCGVKTAGTQCVDCAFQYSDFVNLIGNVGAPSIYAMFRMYRDLVEQIHGLETELEITRIRKKYHQDDED